jgi:TRAP-type C4-dicarboxylate transport system permease small subunit
MPGGEDGEGAALVVPGGEVGVEMGVRVLLLFGGWRIVELTYDINSVATNVNMAIINCTLPIMALATIVLTLKDLLKLLRGADPSEGAQPKAEGTEG